MLIIGDYASEAHLQSSKNKILEILHVPEEKKEILEKLGIDDQTPSYRNNGLEYYKTNIDIRLYDSTVNRITSDLHTKTISSNTLRLANMYLNFSVYKAKVKFRSKNVDEWERNFLKFVDYKYKLIPFINKEKMDKAITTYHLLTYYNYIQENTISTSYQYNTSLLYDKYELYTLLSDSLNPPFESIIKERDGFDLDLVKWDKLNHDGKIEAILECLYVDTAIEYLIPEIDHTSLAPENGYQYFIYSIMNLMTSTEYPFWLKIFIENNYYEIIANYKGDYIMNLLHLIKNNVLREVDK